MKIAMLGYGKMGKAIEQIALKRDHEFSLKINSTNIDELNEDNLSEADVAIEFSKPEMALQNIRCCLESGVPVVIGTTGWYDHMEEVKQLREKTNGAMLAATNFSVGVNLFFELNKKLARLMNPYDDYRAEIIETHHKEKLDSPSGTAISLAEQLIENHNAYSNWKNEKTLENKTLGIISKREEEVKGTHLIRYDSSIDTISIEHFAKNRDGFALGAILAAEYIADKKGLFTMKDVLNI